MVRLKDDRPKGGRLQERPFQFHYGTIKRFDGFVRSDKEEISIPLWYD